MSSQSQPSKIRFQDLPDEALIRLRQMIALQVVPFSASSVWRLCRKNRFPRPIKLSAGVTAWRVGAIRKFLREIENRHQGEQS